jgi:trimethylamine--corrinoid protein Co-methyltransferase
VFSNIFNKFFILEFNIPSPFMSHFSLFLISFSKNFIYMDQLKEAVVDKMTLLKLFSKREMYNIHLTSLDILQEVGVIVPLEEILRKLDEAGAEVDYKSQNVRIPFYLAEEAIRKTVHRYHVYYRDMKTTKVLGGDQTYFSTIGYATNVFDVKSRTYRKTTQQDLINATKLADALENADFYMCMVSPTDIPVLEVVDRYMWMLSFLNTKKHIISEAMHKEGVLDAVEMASAIVGGEEELRKKPIMTVLFSVTSPFRYDKATLEAFVQACKLGIPTIVNSGPIAGATSPATLAGTTALNIAEHVSALVIRNVINEKAPITIGSWARTIDMLESSPVLGGPEFALLHAGVAQMAHYYGIPACGGGVLSDSKTLDIQTGYEKALTAIVPALAGLNLVGGMGLIASENTLSLEQLIIDDEIVSFVKRIMRGIEVNEETLALDVMRRVGTTGSFLKERHTLNHFRKEIWMPKLTDRTFPEVWVKAGANDLWVKAREKAEKILVEHEVEPVPKEIRERLESIVKRAEERSK